MILYKFPAKLKELMQRENISQKDLAEKLSTTQPTINRWLKGQNQPSLETLITICVILKTTPNYILGFDDNDTKAPYAIELDLEAKVEDVTMNQKVYGIFETSSEGGIHLLSKEQLQKIMKQNT